MVYVDEFNSSETYDLAMKSSSLKPTGLASLSHIIADHIKSMTYDYPSMSSWDYPTYLE